MMGNSILKKMNDFVGNAGVNIFYAILILLVGLAVISIINRLFKKWIIRTKVDPMLHIFVFSVVRITLIVLLAISCAGMIGLNVTSFITALGAAGLAVGLALQGSLTNLAGGVFIIVTKPFGIHDYVEAGAESGSVKQIGIVYTTLLTPDNRQILIPNADVAKSKIINYSANPQRRLDLEFSVSYDTDLNKVKQVLEDTVSENPLAQKDPAPFIRCSGFGENAFQIACRVWVLTKDYWDLNFDLYEQVKAAFDKEGISIAYRKLDVNIEK